MKVNVRLKFNSQKLIQKYCDSQGIPITDCLRQSDSLQLANRSSDCNVRDILEDELKSWLNDLGIEVEKIQEVGS